MGDWSARRLCMDSRETADCAGRSHPQGEARTSRAPPLRTRLRSRHVGRQCDDPSRCSELPNLRRPDAPSRRGPRAVQGEIVLGLYSLPRMSGPRANAEILKRRKASVTFQWIYRALAVAATAVAFSAAEGQQRNIVFTGVPDFLKHQWELVAGPDSTGAIVRLNGHVITGNQIIMLSTKNDPKVAADYLELDVDTVVQYNLASRSSETGYNTIFDLKARRGEALIYPGVDFWVISIRFAGSIRYASYVGLLIGHRKDLEQIVDLNAQIEVHRKLLSAQYASLAKGLNP